VEENDNSLLDITLLTSTLRSNIICDPADKNKEVAHIPSPQTIERLGS